MTWTLISKPERHSAFKDDGVNRWVDDDGYVWSRLGDWDAIAKPALADPTQLGAYTTAGTRGAATTTGRRGALTSTGDNWTVIPTPTMLVPLRGGWSDDIVDGGYNEPNKRGGLADTGDGWMTILMPLEPPSP